MITYRSEKGIDLTYEELDENFRTFNSKDLQILGVATVCPIGEKWVMNTQPNTSYDYVVLSGGAFNQGIMTASQVQLVLNALVSKNKQTSHTLTLNPKPIEEFYVAETKQVSYNPLINNTLSIDFDNDVDMIEISTNLTESPTEDTDLYYSNGEVISGTNSGIIGDTYKSNGIKGTLPDIIFTLGAVKTLPTLGTEIDPFGDGSQIHYFKMDGDGTDVCGNSAIVGTQTYTSAIKLWGTHSLEIVNNRPLYFDIHANAYNASAMTILFAGRRQAGGGLADWQMFENSTRIKTILATADSNLDYQYFMGYLVGTHSVYTEELQFLTNKFTIGYSATASGEYEEGYYGADPYSWATGFHAFFSRNGEYRTYSGGMSSTHGEVPPEYSGAYDDTANEENPNSISTPRRIIISDPPPSEDWNMGGAYLDGLRVFNRHLLPSEIFAVNDSGLGDIIPTIYDCNITTEGYWGDVERLITGSNGVAMNLNVNGNLVDFGTATVSNGEITYQYRISMVSKKFTINSTAVSGNSGGNIITVKGYKKL